MKSITKWTKGICNKGAISQDVDQSSFYLFGQYGGIKRYSTGKRERGWGDGDGLQCGEREDNNKTPKQRDRVQIRAGVRLQKAESRKQSAREKPGTTAQPGVTAPLILLTLLVFHPHHPARSIHTSITLQSFCFPPPYAKRVGGQWRVRDGWINRSPNSPPFSAQGVDSNDQPAPC